MHGACCSCVAGVDCIGCQDAAVCYWQAWLLWHWAILVQHCRIQLCHTQLCLIQFLRTPLRHTHTTMSLMTCSQNSVTVTFPHNSVAHNWCYACIVLCNQYRSFSVTPFCYRSVSDLLLPSSCLPILIFPIYSVLVGKKLTCGVIWSFNLIKVFRIGTPFCQCFVMWTNHLRWILALRALCATHK